MDSQNPLVSVCMPLFNTERFVGEAIEGVLNQSYQNIELIICDNKSTDRSIEIVERYSRQDSRVRLVKNKRNLGYAGNLHKVTSLATGEFMIVQCADDLSSPDGIKRMVELATGGSVDRERCIILSDAYVRDEHAKPTSVLVQNPSGYDSAGCYLDDYVQTGAVRRFKGKEALSYALPRLRIVGWLGATMYSRTLFQEIEGIYNGLLYSPDLQYNYHLLAVDPDVAWVNEPLFSWRLHESNQISQAREDAIPKAALDMYTYTFSFSTQFLSEVGVRKEQLIHEFVQTYCIRKAMEEINSGSFLLALRHLFFGLATYPKEAVQSAKFWLALAGVLAGPFGRIFARLGYHLGIWRRKTVNLKSHAGLTNQDPVNNITAGLST